MKITELKVQRFRIPGGISKRMFILDPHEEGEWVSYADYCKVLQTLIDAQIPENVLVNPKLQCGAKLEIEGTNGIGATYCMKPLGHSGDHERYEVEKIEHGTRLVRSKDRI